MATIFLFLASVVWGSLSAQFFVQVIASTAGAVMLLCALAFSRFSRVENFGGFVALSLQACLFASLFVGGNLVLSHYIDYSDGSAVSVAGDIAFVLTFVYCAAQIPGKLRFCRLSAWHPGAREEIEAMQEEIRQNVKRIVQEEVHQKRQSNLHANMTEDERIE